MAFNNTRIIVHSYYNLILVILLNLYKITCYFNLNNIYECYSRDCDIYELLRYYKIINSNKQFCRRSKLSIF